MAETLEQFRSLMKRARRGCGEAARELYNCYTPAVQRIVRRHLSQRMRSQFDSVDFLQQVWQSFFLGDLGNPRFESPEALISFLCAVALNKVRDEGRRQQTLKRDFNRAHLVDPDGSSEFPVVGPTPSQEAIAGERYALLLDGQPEHVRTVLEMLRQGFSHRAIADAVGISEKFIQRILQQLSERHGPR